MKTLSRNTLTLLIAASLASPFALFAADNAASGASGNATTPEMQQRMQERMQVMQVRMQAIHGTADQQARMPMMNAQMQDMQAMMKDMNTGCPMMAGGMGGGMGMMNHGAMMGMPGSGAPQAGK